MITFNDKEISALSDLTYAEAQRLAEEHAKKCRNSERKRGTVYSLDTCQKSAKPCKLAAQAHQMEKLHLKLYDIWEARW